MANINLAAHYVKTSLNLAKIEQKNADLPMFQLVRKERHLLLYSLGETKYICVYSFGVVVICGIDDPKEVNKLLKRVMLGEEDVKISNVEPETHVISLKPEGPETVEFDYIQLKELKVEKLLLIFHVMAQSVAIDFIDGRLKEQMQAFENVHSNLEQKGRLVIGTRQAMRIVGTAGNMTNFIVSRLSLLDDPAITWEDKDAEMLYVNLRKSYELDDRFSALQFKLEFINESSGRILDVLATRRSEIMEIIIIVLIAVEVVLFFFGF